MTSKEPLSYVHVVVQEIDKGDFTDDNGQFTLKSLCAGHYHILLSHIGCEPQMHHIDIESDTTIFISMDHSSISLESIVISEQEGRYGSQANQSISNQIIEDNLDKNLSTLLEKESGVAVIKNGNGIAKPVVHGMYGNRLVILNNGVPQSGQQWGNDHSPEIDPLSSDKITIIKGASALEYFGNNLGSLILVEPKPIQNEPHIHGRVNYAYDTNGRGQNVNVRMQQGLPQLAWRVNGTLKKYGDRQSPSYFLNNTGSSEANLSVQLEKKWSDRFSAKLYGSTFNAELGVLRGSHIGNLTDLESALSRDKPFFTDSVFSYQIEAPRQTVSHHLAKAEAQYILGSNSSLKFTLANQLNHRKEYDVRRGGRTSTPALNIKQLTTTAEIKYLQSFTDGSFLKFGAQTNWIDNGNVSGTGIRPLIPNYFMTRGSLFGLYKKESTRYIIELGASYLYEHQNVATLTTSFPWETLRYRNDYHSMNAMLGFSYKMSEFQRLILNTGYASRNPGINELYSFGLHQGVSGIEQGDPSLQIEKAVKTTLEYKILRGSSLSFSALLYYQYFDNYIYLRPELETRLTIRGAFPVYTYDQTDAGIYGLDLSGQFSLGESTVATVNYSFIKGKDLTQSRPLINLPSNSLFTSLTYSFHNPLVFKKIKFGDTELELSNRYVFAQDQSLEEQDFVAPPDAYNLIGLKLTNNLILPKNRLRFYIKADNLFNTEYRDYLDRQRYFADAQGRSWVVGLNLKF